MHVGMVHALYERGIVPDMLVGTSAGAINAAFVASRPPTIATAEELARIWSGLRREDIFPVRLGTLVGGFCGRRDHLVSDGGLRRLICRHLQFDDLADAPIPLHVVAFDLIAGSEVLLSCGPAAEALGAAAAIPGIFPPVETGGRRLIDGGVVNNTPVSHAVSLGAETIYVLPAQAPARRVLPVPRGALDAAILGLGVLLDRRLQLDLVRYSEDAELIVLPAVNTVGVQPTSFDHADRLIRDALVAARSVLDAGSTGKHLRLLA